MKNSKGVVKKLALVAVGLTAANLVHTGNLHAIREPDPELEVQGITLNAKPEFPGETGVPRVSYQSYRRFVLAGRTQDTGSMRAALLNWIDTHASVLGHLKPSDLSVRTENLVPGSQGIAGTLYINFQQKLGGLPVEGTYLNFTVQIFKNKPIVTTILCQVYPKLSISTAGKFSAADLEDKARKRLNIGPNIPMLIQEKKIKYIEGAWRAVQEVQFQGVPTQFLRVAVDLNTGETFVWDARTFADITGHAGGRGVAFDPVETSTRLVQIPLPDLLIRLGLDKLVQTDDKGNFSLPNADKALPALAKLSGKWAEVKNQAEGGKDLSFSGTATPGTPLPILFNPKDALEDPTAQVNGFVHANIVHNYVKSKGVAPKDIDVAIPVNVNIESKCNAYYDYASINFFKAGGRCINTAYDTVVYHEYGHFVDDKIGGITHGGLSEGWGDILAMFITGQPLVGEGFFGEKGSAIRTGDNKYQYNRTDEVHKQGQAWMGFAWHLRENLIKSLGPIAGIAKAEALIIPVLLNNSPDILAAVKQVAMRDMDEKGKMPHRKEILAAAQIHGLEDSIPAPGGPMAALTSRIASLSAKASRTIKAKLLKV